MDLYAIYLRRSRADLELESAGQFNTLAKHETELTNLARARGYVIDEIYRELVSGEHISERPEFQRMMSKVSEYKGIIVHSVSRLGRGSALEYGWTLQTLQLSATEIVTPSKTYDPLNEDDARFLQTEMFISNMELGNIKARMQAGVKASARQGCFVSSHAPMGYDRARIDGKWTLTPNDDAPLIRHIFELAAAGMSYGSIASDLNSAGVRTSTGAAWTTSRIGRVVRNPHYKGKLRYGYCEQKQVPDGLETKRIRKFNEDCILVDGLHEGLVNSEMWDAANTPRGNSTHTTQANTVKNPLAGLIVCAKCGHAMTRHVSTKGIETLVHPRFVDCHMRSCRLDYVIESVSDALAELEIGATLDRPVDTHKSELAALSAQLEREENKLDKLLQAYYADAITVDELKERRDASESAAASIRAKIKAIPSVKTPEDTKVLLKSALSMLKSENTSARAKNDALKLIVKRIEFENLATHKNERNLRLRVVLL